MLKKAAAIKSNATAKESLIFSGEVAIIRTITCISVKKKAKGKNSL